MFKPRTRTRTLNLIDDQANRLHTIFILEKTKKQTKKQTKNKKKVCAVRAKKPINRQPRADDHRDRTLIG
jgi:hypothetical protein